MQPEKILSLFEELQQKKTLVNLRVAGRQGYNRLTMVIGVRDHKKQWQFAIDPPKGFDEAVVGRGEWTLLFQLTGPDKLEYRFTTHGGVFEDREIWINFPHEVERIQRRRFFRVPTVPGTRLCFTLGGKTRDMDVINISIGGVLAMFVRRKGEPGQLPLLKIKDEVQGVQVTCPLEGGGLVASIPKMHVIRTEADNENDRMRYAFRFTVPGYKEEKQLSAIVYGLQRYFLRHR